MVTVLVMLLAGGLILYSLWFLIAATSIWFVKTWNATEVLRALLASGRYPLNAYPPALRLLFTLVLPVACFLPPVLGACWCRVFCLFLQCLGFLQLDLHSNTVSPCTQ